jgi:hypothetical protein
MPNEFINQSQLAGAAAVACSELLGVMVESSIKIPYFFDDALGIGWINSPGVKVAEATVADSKCLRVWLQGRRQWG